jgi:hypothetical protein
MVLGFVAIFRVLRLVDRGWEVFRIGDAAFALLRDPNASDFEKEKGIQRYSLQLLRLLVVLVVGAFASFTFPLLVVWALGAVALVNFKDVLEVATSGSFLVLASAMTTFLLWWFDRRDRRTGGIVPGLE